MSEPEKHEPGAMKKILHFFIDIILHFEDFCILV